MQPIARAGGIVPAYECDRLIPHVGFCLVGVGSKEAMKEADYAVEDTSQLDLNTILEKAGQ